MTAIKPLKACQAKTQGFAMGMELRFYNLIESELSHRNDLPHIRFGNSRPRPLARGHAFARPRRSPAAYRRDAAH